MSQQPLDPGLGRREFLAGGLGGGLLLGLGQNLGVEGAPPRARAAIQIVLEGGLSHLDSFDPKPYAPVEVRGDFGTLKSKLDGEPLSRVLRDTARIADRITIVRSMSHGEAAHERGLHNILTGYRPSPAITYPSFGSVVSHELHGQNRLPPYVVIPRVNGLAGAYLGSGYLSAAHGAFSTRSDPGARNFRVKDLAPPRGLDAARLARRRDLVGLVGAGLPPKSGDGIEATQAFYDQAWDLVASKKARGAFDLGKETKKLRDSYGTSGIGPRLLLARRLVEAGVRYVVVRDGGYDNHRDIFRSLKSRLGSFDRAFARLVSDLDARGLLDSTLILVTTEFGRTSRVNADRGRDHWPKVFSVVLAGGGVKRGHIHGASDASGREPEEAPVSPSDLSATLFSLMGIDPHKWLMSPGGRPIAIARGGRVLKEILA